MESQEKIFDALIKYISDKDISITELAKQVKIAASSIYGYLDGKTIGKRNKLKLSVFLKDYL